MAQAGFTPIRLYHSTTATNTPLAGNLAFGELAVNAADGKLYYKNSVTNLVALLADAATATGSVTGGTAGALVYQSAPSTSAFVSIGANGFILTSNGTVPVYTNPASITVGNATTAASATTAGSATTATTATNIAGGLANQLVYQTGVGATGFAPAPTTAGFVLGWTGTAFSWVSAPAATSATNLAGGAAFQVPYQTAPGVTAFSSDFQFNGTFLRVGNTTPLAGATNPTFAATANQNLYVQSYIYNANSGTSASADFVAYGDNSTDVSGWMDVGFTSSTHSDPLYGVTGANEAYVFGSAPSGAGKSGNLVYATDSTGTTNSHQWYVGGFAQAKNAWRMQLTSTGLQLSNALAALYGGTGLTDPGPTGNLLTSTGSAWVSAAAPVTGPSTAKTYYMAQF